MFEVEGLHYCKVGGLLSSGIRVQGAMGKMHLSYVNYINAFHVGPL